MPYTLSSSLSSVPTDATVTRDAGGRVYINDTITLNTGAVVDVDLVCVGFVVPTGQTVTFGRTAADGTDIPISVVMTLAIAPYSQGAFHIVGNPTINVRNTTFHALNSSNMWGSWPGVVNTTGSILNATNMRIVLYSNLTTRTVNTTTADATTWIPGGGVIDGLEVAGVGSLFFNASPLSTKNIQQRDTPTRGISVASSGATAVDLVGVVAERVNVQQQPCFLRITNLRLLDNYVRNAATAGGSRFAIRKSIGGTLIGISADTRVSVWNRTANTLLHTRTGTAAFNPLIDCWRVYENNTTPVTAAQIEAGVSAEAGSYVPNVRIAILEYGRALAIRDYTLSIRQVGDDQPIDLSQILASSDVDESDAAVVAAWTSIDTGSRFRDRAHLFLRQNWSGQASELVTLNGNLIDAGSYNVTLDATAAQAFAVAGSTITIKASTFTGDMTTTGVITLANGATFVGTRTDANGTVAPPKTVSITGITAGSRLQIYNVTAATEIVNAVVAGTSYSATYNEGTGYTTGDIVRVRLTYTSGTTAKLPYSAQAVVGASGWSVLAAQQDDTVYATLGIDGSTVTEFTSDFPNVQVDISDPDGSTRVDRLYAWFVHTQSSNADGIRLWFGGIVPEDAANFRIVTSILNLKIDNVSATGVTFTDGRRLYRDDDASPLVSSTTGGGSITFFAGKVFTVNVGGSALTPSESAKLMSLPDSAANANAVLTAAQSAPIHSEIRKVNGYTVSGEGTEANPWGPV